VWLLCQLVSTCSAKRTEALKTLATLKTHSSHIPHFATDLFLLLMPQMIESVLKAMSAGTLITKLMILVW